MTIKAVAYDVDGVLVRSYGFADVLERDHGIDNAMQKAFFQGPFRECVVGRADMKEIILPFLTEWGWSSTLDDFVSEWFKHDGVVNDEVLATVPLLRAAGYTCCVASTQETHRASWLEESLRFGTLFDHRFFSCRLGKTKDDVTFFDDAARALALDPNEILFFDDAEGIVENARKAGWNAEVYAFGDDFNALLSKHGVQVRR